jgi:hypothetical protein
LKIARKWTGQLSVFLEHYRYQPDLTQRLDLSKGAPIDQATINEIVLWKVNRYVRLNEPTVELLNRVAEVAQGAHRQASEVLALLLETRGVDLPMASTFLRFRNPCAFQIIDPAAPGDRDLASGSMAAKECDSAHLSAGRRCRTMR